MEVSSDPGLGSFTRRGLMVDHGVPCRHLRGTKHRKHRGCKARKEVVEDRETTHLFVMAK